VTFYASLSGDFSDGYLPSIRDLPGDAHLRSSVEDRLLGLNFGYGDFLYPAASNRWRAMLKSAWKIDANDKLSLSWTKTLDFEQDWGVPDIGSINRNVSSFPWSWARAFDHHYTITGDVNILSLIWNRTLGLHTITSAQFWRHYTGRHQDVAGKAWTEYDRSRDEELPDQADDTPYFVDVGDAPDWLDRYVIVWGLRNDWQIRLGRHDLSLGASAEYHDVQYLSLSALSVTPDKPLGDEFDLFHVTPNAGNLYVQDQLLYEGMAANIGLAYDYWFPGEQVRHALDQGLQPHMTPELRRKFYAETHSLFGYRFKGHLSPRVGVSFPISERAHLFFDYGHYSQRPAYYYVYAKSSSQSGEEYPRIGNPTINPPCSTSWAAATSSPTPWPPR
jgi:hypothetical protein